MPGKESAIQLYELAAVDDDHLYSPYAWTVRFALAYKKLSFESIPWRLVEKDKIAFSGQGAVRLVPCPAWHVMT